MDDKREDQRHRTLKAGLIVFNERRSTIECTIRNLSDSGAQLKVATVIGIPDSFELRNVSDGTDHRCEVAWRREGVVGVRFVD